MGLLIPAPSAINRDVDVKLVFPLNKDHVSRCPHAGILPTSVPHGVSGKPRAGEPRGKSKAQSLSHPALRSSCHCPTEQGQGSHVRRHLRDLAVRFAKQAGPHLHTPDAP